MKKIFSLLVIISLLSIFFVGCTPTDSPVKGKKVAYVMQMQKSEIFEEWSDTARETAESLGMTYDAVFCNGSDETWKNKIEEYASNGYDGLLLSHGGKDYAYDFLKDIKLRYPNLKIVTFDTQFIDEHGATQTIDGVTQFFQQDAELSRLLLDYICNDLYKSKVDAGQKVNVLKVWKGPNYLSAFDRREVGYAEYVNNGLINTVETIAPTDVNNAEEDIKNITAQTLAKYQEGEIDAIWCCYDLYANGVYAALKEGGYDIPMVSVDICDADIAKMSEENSNWKACATSNWNYNGEFGIRALALEINGEYDKIIDPLTNKASNWLELPVKLIKQDLVKGADKPNTVKDLAEIFAQEPNNKSWMLTSDWMK